MKKIILASILASASFNTYALTFIVNESKCFAHPRQNISVCYLNKTGEPLNNLYAMQTIKYQYQDGTTSLTGLSGNTPDAFAHFYGTTRELRQNKILSLEMTLGKDTGDVPDRISGCDVTFTQDEQKQVVLTLTKKDGMYVCS